MESPSGVLRPGYGSSPRVWEHDSFPEMPCQECGRPAAFLCTEYLYQAEDEFGNWYLCTEHAQEHPHEEYGEPLPLVNSPRLGMCGYVGPANPPY